MAARHDPGWLWLNGRGLVRLLARTGSGVALVSLLASMPLSCSPASTPQETHQETHQQTFSATATPQTFREADVVVYGATPSGLMSAIAAKRAGASVLVLEPTGVVGGMASSGVSPTDVRDQALVGGLPREFFDRAVSSYGADPSSLVKQWAFEPHMVEATFEAMLREAGVDVLLHHPLAEEGGVAVADDRITWVTTTDGSSFRAKVYIDASYEGDLMAQAGVAYTWGRESTAEYGEPLAGIRPPPPDLAKAGVLGAVDGQPLPGVSSEPPGTPGEADRSLQAYGYRPCLSKDPSNQVPIAAPAGYDAGRYELLQRQLEARMSGANGAPQLSWVLTLYPLPNDKADMNSDYIGGNVGYPEASYDERARMATVTRAYVQGLLYYLSHDQRVPPEIRDSLQGWGYCADEFANNGNWPPLLYVREARRLIGQHVLTQTDVQTTVTKPDSIGLGRYRIDSHAARRLLSADGYAYTEGGLNAPVQPYEIPFRSLLPASGSVSNLVVTVDVSASHVAWASLRMEPQFMIMGQAGGAAAAMAVSAGGDLRSVDIAVLQANLRATGAVLSVDPVRLTLTPIQDTWVAGVPGKVRVEAIDPEGHAISGYRGTVKFTSTDASALLPPNYTFTAADAGSHIFEVAFGAAGIQALRVRDTHQPSLTALIPAIQVAPG